jgi:hypothetical protein
MTNSASETFQAIAGDYTDQVRQRMIPSFELFYGTAVDAVGLALAIHHLEDDEKRDLFARVFQALRPGGVFVNAEQAAGATPALDGFGRAWLHDAAFALGATEQQWDESVDRRRKGRYARGGLPRRRLGGPPRREGDPSV